MCERKGERKSDWEEVLDERTDRDNYKAETGTQMVSVLLIGSPHFNTLTTCGPNGSLSTIKCTTFDQGS